MPQVTVYIRKEDLEKWRAIEKKSEFIHSALNGNGIVGAKYTTLNVSKHDVRYKALQSVGEVVQNTVAEGEKMLNDMHDAIN